MITPQEMSFKTNTHMRNPKLKIDGLIPYNLSPFGASDVADGPISIGAMADSFYEYLLKQWLQTGKTLDWCSFKNFTFTITVML